ncbi:MAG: DinB family protein [bacterium]|nr:DinB family protein [bacterium]
MEDLEKLRQRYVNYMRKTVETLGHILQDVSQEAATTLRDGPDGWTVLEVVAHLRDFDGFFQHRAQMMLEQENPALPAYDHVQLAIDRQYNQQNLREVYTELVASRAQFREFFTSLMPEQWMRSGIHPERGAFDMMDAALQVVGHDIDHTEQVTRILTQRTNP